MTTTVLTLTEEEFDERYSPMPNPLNPNASWSYDNRGCLFETFGEEFAFVRRFDPHRVWTLIDGDDGDLYLVSGLHFVNRIGYLLTQEAVPPDTLVEVHLPSDADEEG